MTIIQQQILGGAGGGSRTKRLLDQSEAAFIQGLSGAPTSRQRLQKEGPQFIKIGAAVRYRLEDVRGWLETRPSGGEPVAEVGR